MRCQRGTCSSEAIAPQCAQRRRDRLKALESDTPDLVARGKERFHSHAYFHKLGRSPTLLCEQRHMSLCCQTVMHSCEPGHGGPSTAAEQPGVLIPSNTHVLVPSDHVTSFIGICIKGSSFWGRACGLRAMPRPFCWRRRTVPTVAMSICANETHLMRAAFKLAGITEQSRDVQWLRNMPASDLPEPESVVCHTLQLRAMTPTASWHPRHSSVSHRHGHREK